MEQMERGARFRPDWLSAVSFAAVLAGFLFPWWHAWEETYRGIQGLWPLRPFSGGLWAVVLAAAAGLAFSFRHTRDSALARVVLAVIATAVFGVVFVPALLTESAGGMRIGMPFTTAACVAAAIVNLVGALRHPTDPGTGRTRSLMKWQGA